MKYTVILKNGTVYHAGIIEQVGTFIVMREIRENWHQEMRVPAMDVLNIYKPLVPEHVADLSNNALLNLILIVILVVLLLLAVASF